MDAFLLSQGTRLVIEFLFIILLICYNFPFMQIAFVFQAADAMHPIDSMARIPAALRPPIPRFFLHSIAIFFWGLICLGAFGGVCTLSAGNLEANSEVVASENTNTITDYFYHSVLSETEDSRAADFWILPYENPQTTPGPLVRELSPPLLLRQKKDLGLPILTSLFLLALFAVLCSVAFHRRKLTWRKQEAELQLILDAFEVASALEHSDASFTEKGRTLAANIGTIAKGLLSSFPKKGLEADFNRAREMTQGMLKFTWMMLHNTIENASLVVSALDYHNSIAELDPSKMVTEELRTHAALAVHLSRGVRQDWNALKSILEAGERLKNAVPCNTDGATQLLKTAKEYIETGMFYYERMQRALEQAILFGKMASPVIQTMLVMEGNEVIRKTRNLSFELATMKAKRSELEVYKHLLVRQRKAEKIFEALRTQTSPRIGKQLLDKLKEAGLEAKEAFNKLEKCGDELLPLSEAEGLESLQKSAQAEVEAAEMHAYLGEFISRATYPDQFANNAGHRHSQVTQCASEAKRLLNQMNELLKKTQAAAEDVETAHGACKVKELGNAVYEKAVGVARLIAEQTAWMQLDSAVHTAIVPTGIDGFFNEHLQGLDFVQGADLRKKDNPKVIVSRYRNSKQLKQARRQALRFLGLARRTETRRTNQQRRHRPFFPGDPYKP